MTNELVSLALGGFGGAALRRADRANGQPNDTSITAPKKNSTEYAQPVDSVELSGTGRNEPGGSVGPAGGSVDPAGGGKKLSSEEQEQVRDLKQRDAEVRQHEQAHKAAAGSSAAGGPSFEFQTGPDGRQYAVGGEVQIDTSPVQGDPQATIAKMQQIRRAALSPAEPSGQDRAIAAQAQAAESEARRELREEQQSESTTGGRPAPVTSGAGGTQQPEIGAPSRDAGSNDVGRNRDNVTARVPSVANRIENQFTVGLIASEFQAASPQTRSDIQRPFAASKSAQGGLLDLIA